MMKRYLIFCLVFFFTISVSSGSKLSIKGIQFFMDGVPFNMVGIRVASATQSDSLTNLLVNQLDDYSQNGINAISIYTMGSSGGFSDPFSPNGKEINEDHKKRLITIVEECDKRSMVVVVGVFYQRLFSDKYSEKRNLRNKKAIINASQTVTNILKPYGNIIINIANEQNSGYYKNFEKYDFTNPENVIALCKTVKAEDSSRIVGGGGYKDGSNVTIGKSEHVDVLLFDTYSEDVKNGHTSGWHYDYYASQGVVNKPMVNVEIFGAWTRIAMPPGVFTEEAKKIHLKEIDEAMVRPGLSVFFHSNPWCQGPADGYPVRYELGGNGTEEDPGIKWWAQYAASKTIFIEKDGLVTMEAENAAELIGWKKISDLKNGSDITLMDLEPREGGKLVFPIQFKKTGTYVIWALHAKSTDGFKPDQANDCFAEFDGKPLEIQGKSSCCDENGNVIGLGTHQVELAWESRPKTECAEDRMKKVIVNVETPGFHVLKIKSRSKGYLLDKLVLAHESLSFIPSGKGPSETR